MTFVVLKHGPRLPTELPEIGLELRSDSGQNAAPTYRRFCHQANLRPICIMPATELSSWDVERRDERTVLVRVHSSSRQGRPLPDAVFAFRNGDPQYDYWASQLLERMQVETAQ
jgi:hypothetical protein